MRKSVLLVLAGIVSVQVGAAAAKDLFGRVDPTTLVWLRLSTSAVVLALLARPRVRRRPRGAWTVVLGFAATLAVMNWAIYQSFARIPLGLAVTLEFVGPLTVALAGSRRPRDLIWGGLAGVGVLLLGHDGGRVTVAGAAFALLAGACWGGYILLSARTGRAWPGLDGLAVASVIAAVVLAPFALVADAPALGDGHILLVGALVGLLSSVIPYSVEMAALRRLPAATFGTLMSLEPAAAALAGLVVLGEVLAPVQWVAVGCVVVASAGATRTGLGREPAPN